MKQYIYDRQMIEKNYLASYADILFWGDRLFLINTLTDRQVTLEGDIVLLEKLAGMLKSGINDEELQDVFYELGMPGILDVLLREGMIE